MARLLRTVRAEVLPPAVTLALPLQVAMQVLPRSSSHLGS